MGEVGTRVTIKKPDIHRHDNVPVGESSILTPTP